VVGKGRGSEDRRVEPIISLTSLTTKIARKFNFDENTEDGNTKINEVLQDWQDNVYQNEEQIAIFLGYLLQKHKPQNIKKLIPLHGKYYDQMKDRQKNAFNRFMEIVTGLQVATNCFDVGAMHKIFEISACQKYDKNAFGKKMCQWLIDNTGIEWKIGVKDVYINGNTMTTSKRTVVHIPPKMGHKSDKEKEMEPTIYSGPLSFDIWDFIEYDRCDDKGKELDDKPHANNIKDDLL